MHTGIDVAKYQKLMDDENNWAKSHSERRKGLSKITIDYIFQNVDQFIHLK